MTIWTSFKSRPWTDSSSCCGQAGAAKPVTWAATLVSPTRTCSYHHAESISNGNLFTSHSGRSSDPGRLLLLLAYKSIAFLSQAKSISRRKRPAQLCSFHTPADSLVPDQLLYPSRLFYYRWFSLFCLLYLMRGKSFTSQGLCI